MPGAATVLAVVLVVCGWALAGCGSGPAGANPEALPTFDPNAPVKVSTATPTSAGAGPSARPTSTTTPLVHYTPGDVLGKGAWVVRGKVVAGSAQKRAAVDAASRYIAVRVRLSNTWVIDEQALAAVATGQAVTSARQRLKRERGRAWRSVGPFTLNVSSVQINGSTATVTGCNFDGTSEVDENGQVVIAPPGGVRIPMKLQLTGDTWQVTDWPDQTPACTDWPKP
jgi:hypothetical protein